MGEQELRDEIEWLDEQIAAARSLAITGMYEASGRGDVVGQERFRAIVSRLAGVRRVVPEKR
jgi:hypothetical protein